MDCSPRLSTWTSILLLSLPFTHARAVEHLAERIGGLWKRRPLAQLACGQDDMWTLISNRDDKTAFCSRWNSVPNATVTSYYTPLTTTTDFTKTLTTTVAPNSRVHITSTVTPTSTVWITERPAKVKRAPVPTPKPNLRDRMIQADSVDAIINAVMANDTTIAPTASDGDQAEIYSAISSACSCHGQFWPPMFTDTFTETEPTSTRTMMGYTITTYSMAGNISTISHATTVSAITITSTTTLSGTPASSEALATAAPSQPPRTNIPFGVDFQCPEDHGSEQVILHGSDSFFYRIYCGTTFSNETVIWSRNLASHSDCLGACSSYNEIAQAFACKGSSFDGITCALYGTADIDSLVNSTSIDSAVLEQALVQGRNTTLQNRQLSPAEASSVSSELMSQTVQQTLITPPAMVTQNATGYSACSTTTFFSSADGLNYASSTCSWGSSWYAAWQASATTIYITQKVIRSSGSIGGGDTRGNSGGLGNAAPGQAASASHWATSTATANGTGGIIPMSTLVSETTEAAASSTVELRSGASSGANFGGTGGLSAIGGTVSAWSSAWESNSTSVWASTDVAVSAGAMSGAISGGTGGISPLPATSSWTSNHTNIPGTSADTHVSVSVTTGALEAGTGGVSPLPSVWSSWYSNDTTIIGTSIQIDVSSGASSGLLAGVTGGISPIATSGGNVTAWSGVTGSGTSGGTDGISPIPTSAWSNSTIVESVTTVIEVSSWATSGSLNGGTNGASPLPNATVPASAQGSLTPSNNTVVVESTTTIEVEGADSYTNSRTQGPRTGSQSPSWLHNFTNPFPSGTGTGPLSTEGSPLTTAAPTSMSSQNGYGEWPESDSYTWSRSRRSAPRDGSQAPPTSGVPEETETASSGFPILYPNSTTTHSTPSKTGYFPPPTWNTTTPSGTGPAEEEIPRSSWLGELYYPSSTPGEGIGTSGWPLPTSNGTWSPSRTQGPRSGSVSSPTSFANSTIAGPIVTGSGCPILTTTKTETVFQTVYPSTCPQCPEASAKWGGGYGKGSKGGKGGPPPWVKEWFNDYDDDDEAASSTTGTSRSLPVPPHLSPSSIHNTPGTLPTGPVLARSQQSIDEACRTVGNVIYNGEFELGIGAWGFDVSTQNHAQFLTVRSSTQRTIGGRHFGRVILSAKTATAKITQTLSLCPGATYSFKAWTRVERPLAQCEVRFNLNNALLGVVLPTHEWTNGIARTQNFTAKGLQAGLEMDIRCPGTTSQKQLGTLDIDDISLERMFS